MELRYKLSSYGIPDELLPLTHKGILKFEHHHNYLDMQKAKLRSNPNDPNYREIVACPRSNDVVFRKGTAFKNNVGNDLYRELLRERSLEYFRGDRGTRRDIAMSIIADIEGQNGLFLEWKNKQWLVFRSHEDIRKKISASFKQYNRGKNKERDQLVKAIQSAVAINTTDGQEGNFCRLGACGGGGGGNTANFEDQAEYTFLENPGKLLKAGYDENSGGSGGGGDNQCFGMSFTSA